jgi:hypothetical protein
LRLGDFSLIDQGLKTLLERFGLIDRYEQSVILGAESMAYRRHRVTDHIGRLTRKEVSRNLKVRANACPYVTELSGVIDLI